MKTATTVCVVLLGIIGSAMFIAGLLLSMGSKTTDAPAANKQVANARPTWYLMLPLVVGDRCYADLPYSQWQLMDSYATSAECHRVADQYNSFSNNVRWLTRYSKDLKKQGYSATPRALQERLNNPICLSSDDEHLKEQPAAEPTPEPEAPAADPNYKSL